MSSDGTDRRWLRYLSVAATVVVLDQWSKDWALDRLSGGRTIDLVWTLRFALGRNSGMAFSRGQGLGEVIGAVAIIACGVLTVLVRRSPPGLHATALALILGGAAGNVVDRLFRDEAWLRGHVVDFIDLQWFPSFNVADAAITVGAVLVVSLMAFRDEAT